jgi:hypothetical protein
MFSTAKPSAPVGGIPVTLILLTAGLAALAGIPAGLLGGAEGLTMMAVGAGVSLAIVLGGYGCVRLAFRGPDRFAVKLVVGGFLIRLVLLALALAALVNLTSIDPGRFVLWLVTFYFTLVMAEAWILARAERRGSSS